MLNVVIAAPSSRFGLGFSDENMRKIAAVSPEINLKEASVLLSEEQNGDFSHKKDLDALFSGAEVLLARSLPNNVIKRAPRLKWIQMTFAGMESIVRDKDLVESPVKLTNASGIQAAAISEYVITLMLAFDKHLPTFAQLKREKKWQPSTMVGLASQTVGILGLGNIGKEIARRARALGMHVIAYDRPRRIMRAQYVDKFVSGPQIADIFKESDFVVSVLPSTPQTAGLIGEKELRMMKPSAYLINISRGAVVNEGALVWALEEKWISGAGLDVFTVEPLPKESKLWDFPNTILSPHCCGRLDDTDDRVADLFCDNLKRYLAGKRLLNLVDKKKGF
jgi:phosphoglycerate dehydrogenase-like enzyme